MVSSTGKWRKEFKPTSTEVLPSAWAGAPLVLGLAVAPIFEMVCPNSVTRSDQHARMRSYALQVCSAPHYFGFIENAVIDSAMLSTPFEVDDAFLLSQLDERLFGQEVIRYDSSNPPESMTYQSFCEKWSSPPHNASLVTALLTPALGLLIVKGTFKCLNCVVHTERVNRARLLTPTEPTRFRLINNTDRVVYRTKEDIVTDRHRMHDRLKDPSLVLKWLKVVNKLKDSIRGAAPFVEGVIDIIAHKGNYTAEELKEDLEWG